MKVEAVMAAKGREVATINPTATLATVAQRLRLQNIGALVVLEGDRLAGMISERDVVHAFAAHRAEAAEIEVADVMTRNVVTCRPEDSLTRVLGLMTRHRVRHLPVLEGGRLAGLISIGDAVKHRLDELELEAAVLRDAYIAGPLIGAGTARALRRGVGRPGGTMSAETTIGCIGLGVMGEPICANLLRKSGCPVVGYDLRPEPLARLADKGLEAWNSAEDVARDATLLFLSLPGGPELADLGARLLGVMRPGARAGRPLDGTRRSHPRARRKVRGAGRGICRCAGGAHPLCRRARRALRHGRR